MKKYITTTIIFILFYGLLQSVPVNCQNPKVIPGKIAIKFEKNSGLADRWMKNTRSGEIPELKQMLGSHSTKGYLSDNIITALERKQMLSSIIQGAGGAENLSRICLAEFSKAVDPTVAAGKISTLPGVEYAEPVYPRYLAYVPNDPDIVEQYYLANIDVFEAWDHIDFDSTVVIGIVDTGVLYTHKDLADNIFVNQGETGTDSEGNDKTSNGIDDDGNGYVDDWRGWDLVSSNTFGYDNDPIPGNGHGTHVAGIAAGVADNHYGIAGTAPMAKIIPVKCGPDNPWSRSVENGFEGILYAAIAGADVINCSWGGSDFSNVEQEIINQVIALDAVVAAAAGNDNLKGRFYPAAYDGVMSVAALARDDVRANYSNYYTGIDVSAPGNNCYSTIPPYNLYSYDTTFAADSSIIKIDTTTEEVAFDAWSGTSMASPVAAGVTALVRKKFPNLTVLETIEWVKAACDNIDSLNEFYAGNLGRGRVNALKALTQKNPRACILSDYEAYDENGDGDFDKGETIRVKLTFQNVLSSLKNASIKVHSIDPMEPNRPVFLRDSSFLGNLSKNQIMTAPDEIVFIVPETLPYNYLLDFQVTIHDDSGLVNNEYFSLTFVPTYREMRSNNIELTLNSSGNYAYNDYPKNNQGIGFLYKGSENILFEGAFMAGVSPEKISNCARGEMQSRKDESFEFDSIVTLMKPGNLAAEEAHVRFYSKYDEQSIDIEVIQTVYQFDDEGKEDYIIAVYDLVNSSVLPYDSLYAGLYFDWDIGHAGADNVCEWMWQDSIGIVQNVKTDTLPLAGAKLLSSQKINFFAVDNDGESEENPGVWDGFTTKEKWLMLSSGIGRIKSNPTDASMVISAGPIELNPGDTTRVSFSIFAGNTTEDIKLAADDSYITALEYGLTDGLYMLPRDEKIYLKISPVPASGIIKTEFGFRSENLAEIGIYDYTGRKVADIIENQKFAAGLHEKQFDTSGLSQGFYLLRLKTGLGSKTLPFTVLR